MANDLSIVDKEGNSAEFTSFNNEEVAILNNLIKVVNALSSSSGATRSIGERFTSTLPVTDPSVHALDGSVLISGIYSDFVTSIAKLASQYPEYFCTEQEWQNAVTQNGYCDKYVYDSENQTVRLPKSSDNAYVVIANTLKLPTQVEIDNLATDLSTKANKDFSNVTSTAKEIMSKASMPSDRVIQLTIPPSGTTLTAPADGWYLFDTGSATWACLATANYRVVQNSAGNTVDSTPFIPVKKGETVQVDYASSLNTQAYHKGFKFIYAEGSKPE